MATKHKHDSLGPLVEGAFQYIDGIGPGIAQRLHAAGVLTFSRLAALSPQEIYALLTDIKGLTAERIAAQDWPGQARELARQLPQQSAQETAAAHLSPEPEEPGEHQHYATFLVRLLQDENQSVRRTSIVYVQKQKEDGIDSWAGWDPERLLRWVTSQAAISAPAVTSPAPAAEAFTESPAAEESPKPVLAQAAPEPPTAEASPEPVLAQAAPAVPASSVHETRPPAGLLPAIKLHPEGIYSSGGEAPQQFLNIGQPFEVRLSFEIHSGLTQAPHATLTEQAQLLYRAAVETRLPGGQRLRIAEAHGPCAAEGPTRLAIPAAGLEEGVYRFRITLLVYPEGAAQPEREGRFGLSESGPVYVFSRESVLA